MDGGAVSSGHRRPGASYLNDATAFDAIIEYDSACGPGFIGIEDEAVRTVHAQGVRQARIPALDGWRRTLGVPMRIRSAPRENTTSSGGITCWHGRFCGTRTRSMFAAASR